MPEPSRHLFVTHWTQSEIQNGGLGQFFSNHTGILAPEAVVGFQALGMPETSAQLALAMRAFGEAYPRERAARGGVTPSTEIEDRFADLLETEAGGFWDAADRYALKNEAAQRKLDGSGRAS
nr:DUF4375 domain-containing protein [Brevundimonas lenta]